MDGRAWPCLCPHLPLREYVRELEPQYSLLWFWRDRPREWQEGLRRVLRELLALPAQPAATDLDVREASGVDDEGYTRIPVRYAATDGAVVPAWVCVPHDNDSPLPAVVCVHPRGQSKDDLVGLTGHTEAVTWATVLSRQGYLTLAPDLRGAGERAGDERGLAAAGALLGRPLAGAQAGDLLRAVEYLSQRPDVRSDRIGILGLGSGSLPALLAAACDPRVACLALCGGFGTYRELIVATDCFTRTAPPADLVPGLLQYADLDDIACLVAPRPLLLAADAADREFPARSVHECMERTREGYRVQGEQVKLELTQIEGDQRAGPETVLRFMDDWLKLPSSSHAPPSAAGHSTSSK